MAAAGTRIHGAAHRRIATLNPGRTSPRLPARELAAIAAAGALLALLATWPLVLHLSSRVPQDPGDPLLQAWQVAWDGHALAHQPLHFFQANSFWPLRDSLAFSDALIGYTPAGLFGGGPVAATVRYDLLFLGAIALAFGATYLLARELGASRAGAAVGGMACALAPWRLGQGGHLHVLSVGGIPLALFLLLRGYRRGSPALIVAGWLAVAWQLAIGFTLGLPLLYGLGAAGVVVLVRWLRGGRPTPPRSAALATAAGVALLAVTAVLLARPYLRVLEHHPEAHRTLPEVTKLSPPVKSLIAAAPDERPWGAATRAVRNGLPVPHEQLLFPGLAILLLALAGLTSRVYSRAARRWLAVAALVSLVFALGFRVAGEWSPYRLLWELGPGWRGIRVTGRLVALTSIALALLAAAGADRLVLRARPGTRGWLYALPLLAAIALEGLGPFPTARVPPAPAALAAARPPLLELPAEAHRDTLYEFWSTDGFPALVNGFSGFPPRQLIAVRKAVVGFPDRRSVAFLRGMGVRTVIVHPQLVGPLRWWGAERKSVRGLGIERRRIGPSVLFRLPGRPASARSSAPRRGARAVR